MDPEERERELERQKQLRAKKEKEDRERRIKEGLCSKCGKYPPSPRGRRCDTCRARAVESNDKSKWRRENNW
jgi:hypothetical protein